METTLWLAEMGLTALKIAAVGLMVLNVIVFVHELGHYLVCRLIGVTVPVFSIGFGKPLYSFHAWGTKWCLGRYPLGGCVIPLNFETVLAENAAELRRGNRARLVKRDWIEAKHPLLQIPMFAGGPAANLLFALVVGAFILWGHRELPMSGPPLVVEVAHGSRAEAVGIVSGDRIVRINDVPMSSVKQTMVELLFSEVNPSTELFIERDGETFTVRSEKLATDVTNGKMLGLTLDAPGVRSPPSAIEAVKMSYSTIHNDITINLRFIGALILMKAPKNAGAGPIGIIRVAGTMGSQGWRQALSVMVLISIALAFMNLLPIPCLDGFHIVLGVCEIAIGERISNLWRERLAYVGLSILLPLVILFTVSDIRRFFE